MTTSQWIVIRPRVYQNFRACLEMCRFVEELCDKDSLCTFPHSEEELLLWELDKFNRFNIRAFQLANQSAQPSAKEFVQRFAAVWKHYLFVTVCDHCYRSELPVLSVQIPTNGSFCTRRHSWSPLLLALENKSSTKVNLTDSSWFQLFADLMGAQAKHLTATEIRWSIQKKVEYCQHLPNCKSKLDCASGHSDIEVWIWLLEVELRKRYQNVAIDWRTWLTLPSAARSLFNAAPLPFVSKEQRPRTISSSSSTLQGASNISAAAAVERQRTISTSSSLHAPLKEAAAAPPSHSTEYKFPFPLSPFCCTCYTRYRGLLSPRLNNKDICNHKERHPFLHPVYIDNQSQQVRNPFQRLANYKLCTHHQQGKCQHKRDCHMAHSENERQIWNWMTKKKIYTLDAVEEKFRIPPATILLQKNNLTNTLTSAGGSSAVVRSMLHKPTADLFPLPVSAMWSRVAKFTSNQHSSTGSASSSKQGTLICLCAFNSDDAKKWMQHTEHPKHRLLIWIHNAGLWTFRTSMVSPKNVQLCSDEHGSNCTAGLDCTLPLCKEEYLEWTQRSKAISLLQKIHQNTAIQEIYDLSMKLLLQGVPLRQLEESPLEITLSESTSIVHCSLPARHVWNFTVIVSDLSKLQQTKGRVLLLLPGSMPFFTCASINTGAPSLPSEYEVDLDFEMEPGTASFNVHFTNANQAGYFEQWMVIIVNEQKIWRRVSVFVNAEDSLKQCLQMVTRYHDNYSKWSKAVPYVTDRKEGKDPVVFPFTLPSQVLLDGEKVNDCFQLKAHSLLSVEEAFQSQLMLSLSEEITSLVHKKGVDLQPVLQVEDEFHVAQNGEIFMKIPLPSHFDLRHELSDPKMYLLRKSVQMVCIRIQVDQQKLLLFECPLVGPSSLILKVDTSSFPHHMFIIVPRTCVQAMGVTRLIKSQPEWKGVQDVFIRPGVDVNNQAVFNLLHMGIARQLILPNGRIHCNPDTKLRLPYEKREFLRSDLNREQLAFMNHMIRDFSQIAETQLAPPPFMLCGSYGTGKTKIIGELVRHMLSLPSAPRTLICTRTNSAADIYIVRELHEFIAQRHSDPRFVRIYSTTRQLNHAAQHAAVLRHYSLLNHDGNGYRSASMEDVILPQYKVVVTTLTTIGGIVKSFYDQSPNQCAATLAQFDLIIVDEAAQVLEAEALLALTLARPQTRIVLAGDAMQQKPLVFSPQARLGGLNLTIIDRLFAKYCAEECDQQCLLREVYRSHCLLVQLLSMTFYGGPNILTCNVLANCLNRPSFSVPGLLVTHVYTPHGEDIATGGLRNEEEAQVVANRVENYLRQGHYTGPRFTGGAAWFVEETDICVISPFRAQVLLIRQLLKLKKKLKHVNVCHVNEIQGHEYKIVILSPVLTRNSLRDSEAPQLLPFEEWKHLDFCHEASLLNSVMTRAVSVLEVCGDTAALPLIGTSACKNIWKVVVEFAGGEHDALLTEDCACKTLQRASLVNGMLKEEEYSLDEWKTEMQQLMIL